MGYPRRALRAWLSVCAFLPCFVRTAEAGPHWEYEAGVQAARTEVLSGPLVGLPLSGFVAVGLPIWSREHVRAMLQLGYDDAASRNRIDTQDLDADLDPDRQLFRLQSLVVPVRLVADLGPHSFIELGPEFRLLLNESVTEYRQDGLIPATRAAGTKGLNRGGLAVTAGAGFRWRGLAGQPHVSVRWVEGFSHLVTFPGGGDIRPRGAQLALGWCR